ncbi:MAG: OmpA family protein [Candidatus Aminicenantes bacterium]|nr:OmpA family protein [Candidatus Aminicenantes bacterium]
MNRRIIFVIGLVAVAALALTPACATKKFVLGETATLDQKVEGVANEVEANQKRLSEHDEKLATIGQLITQQDGKIQAVDGKVEEVKTLIRGNLVLQATVKNSDAKFAFESAELSAAAKAVVDQFVQRLIQENKGVYIEIQGHTDNTGSDAVNIPLGHKRAEGVMMYLYKQHRIPLHRMSVVSLGSSMPVADNSSRDGRSQNRRVEILVYE